MKRKNYVLITTVALILMIFATLYIITPLLINMLITPIGSHDDTAAYNLALSSLEFAQNSDLEPGTIDAPRIYTLNFANNSSCELSINDTTVTATATIGDATRILSELYSPTTGDEGDGDVVFNPGDIGGTEDNSGHDNDAAGNIGVVIPPDGAEGPWEEDVPVLEFNGDGDETDGTGVKPGDKVGDHLTIPDAPSLDLTTAGALACWIKLNPSTKKHLTPVIIKGEEKTNFSYGLFINDTTNGTPSPSEYSVTLIVNGEEVDLNTGTSDAQTIKSEEWVHIGGSWDQVNGMRLYVNGELKVDDASKKPIAVENDTPLNIGNIYIQANTHMLIGQIYYPVVLKRGFEPVEVESLYLNRKLYYGLEGTGRTTYPASGAGKATDGTIFTNHSTLQNNVTTTASGKDGTANTAYSFDVGSNQHLTSPNLGWDLIGNHTTELIFKPDSESGINMSDMTLFELTNFYKATVKWTTATEYKIELSSSGVTDSLGNSFTITSNSITTNDWKTFSVACSQTTCTIYIDGEEQGTPITIDPATLSAADPATGKTIPKLSKLFTGSDASGDNCFNGVIDDFSIYGYAQTTSSEPKAQLIAHWAMEGLTEGSGSDKGNFEFKDSTSNGHDGKVEVPKNKVSFVTLNTTEGVTENCFNYKQVTASNAASIMSVPTENMNLEYPFSINLWIKPTKNAAMTCINIQNEDNQNDGNFWLLKAIWSTQLRAVFPGGNVRITNLSLMDGNWHMVTLVYRTDGVSMYYNGGNLEPDGKEVHKKFTVQSLVASHIFFGSNNQPEASTKFTGFMDEIKVFGDVLTAEEIQFLYKSEKP